VNPPQAVKHAVNGRYVYNINTSRCLTLAHADIHVALSSRVDAENLNTRLFGKDVSSKQFCLK